MLFYRLGLTIRELSTNFARLDCDHLVRMPWNVGSAAYGFDS